MTHFFLSLSPFFVSLSRFLPSMLPLGARLSSRRTHSGITLPIDSFDESSSSSSGRRGASSRLAIARRRSKSTFSTSAPSSSSASRTRTRTVMTASSKSASDVWAFDFDGVVCDSVGESAISAWEVRKEKRPSCLSSLSPQKTL